MFILRLFPGIMVTSRMPEETKSPDSFIIETKDLSITYGDGHEAVKHVSLGFPERNVTAIIGPSGCGSGLLPIRKPMLKSKSQSAAVIETSTTLGFGARRIDAAKAPPNKNASRTSICIIRSIVSKCSTF